jgi:RNA polymerase sigma factor (TIGR02999 family)
MAMTETAAPEEVTRLLRAAGRGDRVAVDQVIAGLYTELRRLAAARLGRQPGGGYGHTLQATALVHEAVLRLLVREEATYESRRHFFFAAARAMRDLLVEQARRKIRRSRLGLPPTPGGECAATDAARVLAVDEALGRLHAADARKAEVVRLRFFAGLTIEQTADVMGLSVATIERDWRLARSILLVDLRRAGF